MKIEQAKQILAAYLVGKRVPYDELELAREVALQDLDYVAFLQEEFRPAIQAPMPGSRLQLVVQRCRDQLDVVWQACRGFLPCPPLQLATRGPSGPQGNVEVQQAPAGKGVSVEKWFDALRLVVQILPDGKRVQVLVATDDPPAFSYVDVEIRDAVKQRRLHRVRLHAEQASTRGLGIPEDCSAFQLHVKWPEGSEVIETVLREEAG